MIPFVIPSSARPALRSEAEMRPLSLRRENVWLAGNSKPAAKGEAKAIHKRERRVHFKQSNKWRARGGRSGAGLVFPTKDSPSSRSEIF